MTSVSALRKLPALAQMSDADLMRQIRAHMRLTADAVTQLAALVKEARRRNLPLHEFSTGLPARLLAVADGLLDSELLLKFADQRATLDAVKGVPLPLQKRLAAGETIPVVEFDRTTGETAVREKTLRQLTGPQSRQVFAEGRMLSVREQTTNFKKLAAASRAHAAKQSTGAGSGPRIAGDVKARHIIVGPFRIAPRKFIAAFKLIGWTLTED